MEFLLLSLLLLPLHLLALLLALSDLAHPHLRMSPALVARRRRRLSFTVALVHRERPTKCEAAPTLTDEEPASPLRAPASSPRTLPPPCVSRGTPSRASVGRGTSPAAPWTRTPRTPSSFGSLSSRPSVAAPDPARASARQPHAAERNGGPRFRPRGWRLPHPCRQRALAPRPSRPLAGGVAAGAKGPSSARLGAAPHHPSGLAS